MAFIVKKTIKNNDYYYLNENKRIEGKVKTKTLAYLGKNKKQAEKRAKEILANLLKEQIKLDKIKENMNNKKIEKEMKNEIKKEKLKDFQSTEISIEDMAIFCKRKGFVYQSADIYGGFAGFWDFGHLGSELKNNIKKDWWKFHVWQRKDIVGIDGSIITNPKVWEASGHVRNFLDVAVLCKKCGYKTKIEKSELGKVKCEKCGGEYENKGEFLNMFITNVGPVKEDSIKSYLRPETAQLIFADFKLVYENARLKLPCGIVQIGKSFRNEIAPRDFLFRCREFEQMELEYFINPKQKCPYRIGDSEILIYSAEMQEKNEKPARMKFNDAFKRGIIKTDWHAYWMEQELLWFVSLGANQNKFRIRQHLNEEKSHYALDTWDLEYEFPFGWKELQGMANRTDFDLKQHSEFSKKDMTVVEEINGKSEKILPHVVCEPSQGVERAFLVFMFDAYEYDKERENVVLHLHPKIAPIKAAIFPIVKREDLEKVALNIFDDLKNEWKVNLDISGSIGRRYSRNDEIGTPYCVTIDEESLKNNDVTIRDRDTKKQVRVKIVELKEVMRKIINEGHSVLEFGKIY
jgi:glycyl-tRNA synthetase